MLRLPFMASFFLVVAGLLTIGLASWFRTRALRHGATPQARDPPHTTSFSTSSATFLAALAGITAIAWGASSWAEHLIEAVPLVVVGTFIAVAGSVARVNGIGADEAGLAVRFARRAPFHPPWSALRELVPPASPLGGWRMTAVPGARCTLMPSDLFDHEELLETIVVRAVLQFDGGIWRKEPAATSGEGRMAPWISLGKR